MPLKNSIVRYKENKSSFYASFTLVTTKIIRASF